MHRAGRPEGAAPHTRGGGAGAARGPRLVPSRASRAPGLREGSWGAESRGAPPRPRSSPAERADARHQSPERRAPAETEAGRRGRDSPARAPPRGARAACQISGGQGRTTPPGVGGTIRALAPARRLTARSAPTPPRANASEASGAVDPVRTGCLGETRRRPSGLHSLSPHLRSPRRGGISGRCTSQHVPGSRSGPAPPAYLLRSYLVLLFPGDPVIAIQPLRFAFPRLLVFSSLGSFL